MILRPAPGFRAITLLELLVAVAIGALLIGLSVPLAETFKKRARKAKCISHLRSIHAGLFAYVSDHGHWPQMEEDRYDFTEDEFFGFWVRATEPYGLNRETWICPADRSYLFLPKSERKKYAGSYVVTRFDKAPSTPFRWNQPWAMERGDFHGKGAHMLMPDGSIQDSQNPFYGR